MLKEIVAMTAIALHCTISLASSDITHLKEDYQVIQRDAHDEGSCLVTVPAEMRTAATFLINVVDGKDRTIRSSEAASKMVGRDAKEILLEKLPVGGPYRIRISPKDRPSDRPLVFRNILIGDIWILGGQSNMFGIDVIKEKLPALPYLNMLNPMHVLTDAHWCAGLPPIHRIPDQFAPFTLKGQHPEYTEAQIKRIIADKVPIGGIDCSYFFARTLHAESGVPIGLIPCAMGGALAIWDPRERDKNRYGFMFHHVWSTGGRAKGLLFFQGEQDAIFGEDQKLVTRPSLIYPILTYGQQFKDFVETIRKDCNSPDMPVIFAQICRHHPSNRDRAWETIREAQRQIPESLSHSHCVPTVDLDLIDGLHLDYDSLKRVGERMAFLALPYVKQGTAPRSELKVKSVHFGKTLKPTIVVEFSGVTGRLRASGRPTGFWLKKKKTGEVLEWIYKVDFEPGNPTAAILRFQPDPKIQQDQLLLYYAAGATPYVNISDENDMPVPAFGPLEIN